MTEKLIRYMYRVKEKTPFVGLPANGLKGFNVRLRTKGKRNYSLMDQSALSFDPFTCLPTRQADHSGKNPYNLVSTLWRIETSPLKINQLQKCLVRTLQPFSFLFSPFTGMKEEAKKHRLETIPFPFPLSYLPVYGQKKKNN